MTTWSHVVYLCAWDKEKIHFLQLQRGLGPLEVSRDLRRSPKET